jgi:hypothetical protein
VIAAVGPQRQPPPRPPVRPRLRTAPAPTWADALNALLPSPGGNGGVGVPMAIEVTLDPGTTPGGPSNPRLLARLVRLGRAGWVKSGVSWSALDAGQVERGGFVSAHVDVLRRMYALHDATARLGVRRYYYSSSADRTIDLTDFDRSLWTLLDDARQVG